MHGLKLSVSHILNVPLPRERNIFFTVVVSPGSTIKMAMPPLKALAVLPLL